MLNHSPQTSLTLNHSLPLRRKSKFTPRPVRFVSFAHYTPRPKEHNTINDLAPQKTQKISNGYISPPCTSTPPAKSLISIPPTNPLTLLREKNSMFTMTYSV